MSPEEERIKQNNIQVLAFYKSLQQRLRKQLQLLKSLMRQQAVIINSTLANGPEVKNTLRLHGVPNEVIAKCIFSGGSKGIVVEFPRKTSKKGLPMLIPPFTKPTLADKQTLFKKTDEEIAKLQTDILDNKK